jgi:hypothetical protein
MQGSYLDTALNRLEGLGVIDFFRVDLSDSAPSTALYPKTD